MIEEGLMVLPENSSFEERVESSPGNSTYDPLGRSCVLLSSTARNLCVMKCRPPSKTIWSNLTEDHPPYDQRQIADVPRRWSNRPVKKGLFTSYKVCDGQAMQNRASMPS
jgi:hypothetical protein